MNKQTKKTAGMGMGIVIVFITVMSIAVMALLVVSVNALKNANRLPQMDGEFFSAEAAMNRGLPGIAGALNVSGAGSPAAIALNTISNDAYNRIVTTNNLITTTFHTADAASQRVQISARLNTDAFRDVVRTEVNTYIANSLPDGLPAPHNPTALINGTATITSDDIFFLTGATTVDPKEGMGAPAFVNLNRVGSTDTVELGWFSGDTGGVVYANGIGVTGPHVTGNTNRFDI